MHLIIIKQCPQLSHALVHMMYTICRCGHDDVWLPTIYALIMHMHSGYSKAALNATSTIDVRYGKVHTFLLTHVHQIKS